MKVVALLAAVLSQAPSLAVMTTRRTGVSAAEGVSLSAQVSRALLEAGFQLTFTADDAAKKLADLGTPDANICQAKKACVAELGRQLGLTVLVSVSLAKVGADLGVSLEAVKVDTGAVLATASVLTLDAAQLQPFAQKLADALGVKLKAAVEPKPEPKLSPAPSEPAVIAPPLQPPPPPPHSHAAGAVLLAGAGAAVVTGVVLAVLAGTNAQAVRSPSGTYAYSEAQHLADRGNALATGAAVVGGVGVVLGVGAVLAW